jgi:hypothetical protein
MNGKGRNSLRDSRAQRNDPGDVCGLSGLTDAAEDHFIDQTRIKTRASQQCADRDASKFVSREAAEVRPHLGEGGADAIDYDETCVHVSDEWPVSLGSAWDEPSVTG